MAEYLSDKELELVERFKYEVSSVLPNSEALNYSTAVKFLLARKFDIQRAIDLYISHEQIRIKERLLSIDPFREKVKAELLSGKFTILPARDIEGAALALFTVRLHNPSLTSRLDLLRSLLYQLDAALDNIETQRYGLIFIYDMTDCNFQHFDFELSKKILSLLKDSYPARLRKVLIVNPPIWFKYPFKCLQILLKKKLQERVHMLSANQLVLHLPIFSIPVQLDGHLRYDHHKWLKECIQRMEIPSHFNSLDINSFFDSNSTSTKQEDFRRFSENSFESSSSAYQGMPSHQWPGLEILAKARERRSIHLVADHHQRFSAQDFLVFMERMLQASLVKEYTQLKNSPPNGTYNTARLKENIKKNRYADVHCLDDTRVHLLVMKDQEILTDYIHANFVDGYNLSCAYICTQGPLPQTVSDFWRMIWDYHVLVIVMLTKTKESGRITCHQYWPLDPETIEIYGDIAVINNGSDTNNIDGPFTVTSLLIQNTRSMDMREIAHMQFIGWPDYGAPNSSETFLNYLLLVKQKQEELFKQFKARMPTVPTSPPLVVHCSAGIGRSGTFVAMDVGIDRLIQGDGFVDIPLLVEKIRSQRPGSIQTSDQYVFCHFAMSHFITSRGLTKIVNNS